MSAIEWFWNSIVKKKDDARLATQKTPEGVVELNDIPYLSDGHRYHLFDVYRPEGATGNSPTIIDIHGGGWFYGDKELNKKYCFHLTKMGFTVVNISYRLAPEATYAEQIKDIFAAFNHVAANADLFGIDLNNLFLTGDSAGGHLAGVALNALDNPTLGELFGVKSSLHFRAVCFTCTVFEVTPIAKHPITHIYLKPVIGKKLKKDKFFETADILPYVTESFIPSYFVTCDGDFLRKGVLKAYAFFQEKGIPCELYDGVSSAEHKLEHVFNIGQPWWEQAVEANEGMNAFFRKYIV